MDAFLINPTIRKDADYAASQSPNNMSGDLIPIFLSEEILTIKASKKAVEPAGTIRKFANETIFSHGYTSEEEAASPVDDNDFGFHSNSDTESTSSIRESASLEDLSDHANALQLCTKAQAVQFVSAGKAKVVSVPKLVDLSSPGSTAGPVNDMAAVTTVPKSVGSDTPNRSPRSSSDKSPASSSYREQPAQPKVIRRKPKLPPLQAVPTSVSPRSTRTQTPLAEQRAEFLKHDPFPSNWPLGSPASASPSKRKMPKLSPSFRLKAFSRSRRSNSSDSSSTEGSEGRMDWWSVTTSPVSPDTRNVSRAANQPIPKMVARGASERAPPIVLPPCPADYNDDWDVGYASQWPLRKDSIPNNPTFETPNALKHIQRKSVSAAFATTQA